MKLVQKAAIARDGRYLIVLRAPTAKLFALHWDFPGGTLENGENPLEGIRREIREELGVDSDIVCVDAVLRLTITSDHAKPTHQFTIYKAALRPGKITLSHEHLEYRWATREEILALKIEPFLRRYLEDHALE